VSHVLALVTTGLFLRSFFAHFRALVLNFDYSLAKVLLNWIFPRESGLLKNEGARLDVSNRVLFLHHLAFIYLLIVLLDRWSFLVFGLEDTLCHSCSICSSSHHCCPIVFYYRLINVALIKDLFSDKFLVLNKLYLRSTILALSL